MSCSRSWSPWYAAAGRGQCGPDAELRVSDAERSQVADALSRHFADGRLDQPEFDDRMQQAMTAKRRRDLAGLFADLPPLAVPAASAPELRRRRGRAGLLLLAALLFVVAANVPVWPAHFPWLLLAIVVLAGWWASRRYERRHRGDRARPWR